MPPRLQKGLREEYDGSDKGISIQITEAGHESAKVLHPTSREKVLFYLMNVPFGIQKMSAKYRRPCRNLYQYRYCIYSLKMNFLQVQVSEVL